MERKALKELLLLELTSKRPSRELSEFLESHATGFAVPPPNQIFHYTTADGLLGILESKQLWLTHTSFTNDTGEHRYAANLLRSAIGLLEEGLPANLRTGFQDFHLPFDIFQGDSLFVASFAEDGDLLSQWRGYGGLGTGYALGFDGPTLRQATQNQGHWDGLYQIQYIHTFTGNPLFDALECIAELLQEFGISDHRSLPALSVFLSIYLARCKHPAFQEEREWRVVNWVSDDSERIRFRSVRGELRPYVELSLEDSDGRLPLRSVVCGPTTDRNRGVEAVTLLLKGRGYRHTEVVASQVPFRL
jgi:hypothetical protein